MEIILSNNCLSLTGMLNPSLGYFLQRRGKRFFSQRSKHGAPPDGHWRFIVLCAELAQNKLYITDIQVPRCEVQAALKEAGLPLSGARDVRHELNARDILNLKTTFGL